MNIIEASDYITGKRFIGEVKKEPYRANETTLVKAKLMLAKSPTSNQNLRLVDSAKLFYKLEPDLSIKLYLTEEEKKYYTIDNKSGATSSSEKEELFYSMKIGMCSPSVPAKCIFLLKKCYEQYGTLNVLPKVIPKGDLKDMFSKGYLEEGVTIRDVICSFIQPDYIPLSESKPLVKISDYYEAYVAETDMVAFLPKDIAECLNAKDIADLKYTKKGLEVRGSLIANLNGRLGVSPGVYDMRGSM